MDDNAKNASSYQLDQEILDARGINMTVEEVAGLSTCKYSERVQSLVLNEVDLAFLKGLRRRIKNRVNIASDFHTVNVYWVCKGESSDKETEAVLKKTAGALRHELSTLRIMGEIPYIVFVKDHQEAQVADLNYRLKIADYGDDYVLTEEGHLLKSEFVLNTKLSPEVKAKIKQMEEDLPITEELIPEMTHNVYGLDHAKIVNRLLAARKKSRDAWTNLDTENEVISYRAPVNAVPEPAVCSQSKELANFLLQRQILHKKMAKQLKNPREGWQLQNLELDDEYNPDAYYYGEEMEDVDEEEEDNYFEYEQEVSLEDFETTTPVSNINEQVSQ